MRKVVAKRTILVVGTIIDQGKKEFLGIFKEGVQTLTFSVRDLKRSGTKSGYLKKYRKQGAQTPASSIRDGRRAGEQRGGIIEKRDQSPFFL